MPAQKLLKSIARRALPQARFRYHVYQTASPIEGLRYNPLSTINISPDKITRMMIPGTELYDKYEPGSVVGGDWDQQTKPFSDSIYYRSLKQRFDNGEPWESTPIYKSACNRPPKNYYHGCETPEEVLNRLNYLDEIYESIKQEGYKSQRELRKQESVTGTKPPELDEIRINVDRNGEPVFDDGRHRFAMAKLLDVDQIPVIVIGRHRDWWENGGRVTELQESVPHNVRY